MASPQVIARIESEVPPIRMAVLIGANHAQAAVKKNLLVNMTLLRETTVKRIHGNSTSSTGEATHRHA